MQAGTFDLLINAIALSLSGRKLGVAVLGLFSSLILAGLLIGIGMQLGSRLVVLTALLALIGVWLLWAVTVGAIALLSQGDLSGTRVSFTESLQFGVRHLLALAVAPVLLGLVPLAIFIVEAFIVYALGGSLLSGLIVFLFTLFNLAVLVFVGTGGWLVPAIVTYEGSGPMTTLNRALATVRAAPARAIILLCLTAMLMLLFGLVLTLVVYAAWLPLLSVQAVSGAVSSLGRLGASPADLLLRYALGGGGGLGSLLGGGLIVSQLFIVLLAGIVTAIPYVIFPIAAACAVYPGLSLPQPASQPAPVPVNPPPVGPALMPAAASAVPAGVGAVPAGVGAPISAQPSIAPADQPKLCPKCGEMLRPNARFCAKCGTPVTP